MTVYDVFIPRQDAWRILWMPGLARVTFSSLFGGIDVAVLRFETVPGCDPGGVDFLTREVARAGAPIIAAVTVGDAVAAVAR